MSDDRQKAADELKQWRIRYKDFLAANEAGCALQVEESLRSDVIPAGALGARPQNYPLDADEAD